MFDCFLYFDCDEKQQLRNVDCKTFQSIKTISYSNSDLLHPNFELYCKLL